MEEQGLSNYIKEYTFYEKQNSHFIGIPSFHPTNIALSCWIRDTNFEMKAEIQYFMTALDAKVFIKRVEELVDSIEDNGESGVFIIGDCQIDYMASTMVENSLLTGAIAIDSGGIDEGCTQYLRANKVYKELRNWIKKGYYSRLCSWTEGEDRQTNSSRTRDVWLGPDAKLNKESNSDMELRRSSASDVLFDLAPEMNIMGDIKPKASKKKR